MVNKNTQDRYVKLNDLVLKKGQDWVVQMPNETELSKIHILDVGDHFVEVRQFGRGLGVSASTELYLISDLLWVEALDK